MSKYNLLDIHEGMGYKAYEDAKEAERLEAHPEKDKIKAIQALLAKEKAVKEGEAVDLAIEASQEKAGIEVDESFDSLAKKLDKQKGIDKGEAAKIAGKIANIKRKGGGKGPTAKQKKRMTEVRIDRDVAERIEGMLNIPMKKKFMESFMDLYSDLLESDEFFPEDIINHLNNEMHKELYGYQVAGDRLAGIGESSDKYVDEIGEGAMQPGEGDLESGQTGNMDAYTEEMKDDSKEMKEGVAKDIIQALKDDAKGTDVEIDSYMDSLKRSGDTFDEIDDFVEDFKNYVADKALQEHFGRFLKDYQ